MMRRPTVTTLLLLALAALLGLAPAAAAQTYEWTGGGDGHTWSDSQNWDVQRKPVDAADTKVVINGLVAVTDASASIGELEVKAGATLRGTTFSTNRLVMLCGRVGFDDFTTFGGEIAGGVIEGLFKNTGPMVQRLVAQNDCSPSAGGFDTPYTAIKGSSELLNLGTWQSSVGAYLRGLNCCATSASVVTVPGTGRFIGGAPRGFAIENVVLQVRGRLAGQVDLIADDVTFNVGGPVTSGLGIQTGARIRLLGGRTATIVGSLPIRGGGALELIDQENALGPGRIEGAAVAGQAPATLRLIGGQVRGRLATGAGVRVEKTGLSKTTIRSLGGVPASLVAAGPAVLGGPGEIDITSGATVELLGGATVTGTGLAVVGLSCCSEVGIPTLNLARTTTIGRGATLTIRSMRLALGGATAGPGTLLLDGGRHTIDAGARLASATTRLDGLAEVALPNGTVTVDGAVVQKSADVAGPPVTGRGAGTAILRGAGSWAWRDGDITGRVALNVPWNASGANAVRRVNGHVSSLATGVVAGDLDLTAGSQLTLGAATTLLKAAVSGGDATVTVTRSGVLRVVGAPPANGSTLDGARLVVDGALDLDGRRLALTGPGAEVTVRGVARLDGGMLVAGAVVVRRGGALVGPGTVRGHVGIDGVARFARRGTLDVRGSWTLGPAARLVLARSSGGQDVLDVDAEVKLDGALSLDGFRRPGARPFVLIRGGEISGRFDRVIGRPAATRLRYAAKAVRLTRFS